MFIRVCTKLAVLSLAAFLLGCNQPKAKHTGMEKPNLPLDKPTDRGPNPLGKLGEDPGFDVPDADSRPPAEMFCDEIESYLKSVEPDKDYTQQIAVFCDESGPTERFLGAFDWAYDGTGTPKLENLDFTTNEMYVSRLRVFYSLQVPIDYPISVFVLNPYEHIHNGYNLKDSRLEGRVDNRIDWPKDNNAVQTLRTTYDLKVAKGAGIYDLRQTEANIYMLSSTRRDVAVVTENLLDAEKNPFWVDQRDILAVISLDGKTTYLIGIMDLIVENRFDANRFKLAIDDLNVEAVRQIHHHIMTTKPQA